MLVEAEAVSRMIIFRREVCACLNVRNGRAQSAATGGRLTEKTGVVVVVQVVSSEADGGSGKAVVQVSQTTKAEEVGRLSWDGRRVVQASKHWPGRRGRERGDAWVDGGS